MNVCFSEAQLRMLLSACLDVNGKPGVERRLTLIRMLALACHRWHCSLHQLPSELWEQLFRRRFGDLLWFDDDLVNRLKGEPRQVGTRLIQPRDDMYGGEEGLGLEECRRRICRSFQVQPDSCRRARVPETSA